MLLLLLLWLLFLIFFGAPGPETNKGKTTTHESRTSNPNLPKSAEGDTLGLLEGWSSTAVDAAPATSKFKKIIKRTKKFYAHDEKGEASVGDRVRIEEMRPISKTKRWRLTEVLSH